MGIHLRNSRYEFNCDGCDLYLQTDERSLIDATCEARAHGWGTLHRTGNVQEWYCQTCAIKMGAD